MLPAIRERTVGDPRRELIEVMRAILDVIDRYREAFNVLHHEARYLERRPQYRTAMKKIGATTWARWRRLSSAAAYSA